MLFNKLSMTKPNVDTMIRVLDCDTKQFNCLDDFELDSLVEFNGEFGIDYRCTLRDVQYTYRFCKKLLEMCRDAGYIE